MLSEMKPTAIQTKNSQSKVPMKATTHRLQRLHNHSIRIKIDCMISTFDLSKEIKEDRSSHAYWIKMA